MGWSLDNGNGTRSLPEPDAPKPMTNGTGAPLFSGTYDMAVGPSGGLDSAAGRFRCAGGARPQVSVGTLHNSQGKG